MSRNIPSSLVSTESTLGVPNVLSKGPGKNTLELLDIMVKSTAMSKTSSPSPKVESVEFLFFPPLVMGKTEGAKTGTPSHLSIFLMLL